LKRLLIALLMSLLSLPAWADGHEESNLDLDYVGLIQVQAAPWVGADNLIQDGDVAEEAGFRLRRARFGLKGKAWKMMEFEVSTQADVTGIDLLDAWIGYRLGTEVGLTLGAKKVPFSRFALMGSGKGALIERPMGTTAMAPGRQLGLTVEGDIGDGMFGYAIGAYNGFERRTNFFEGYAHGTALLGNRFTRLATALRVTSSPLGDVGTTMADIEGGDFRLGFGAAGFYNAGSTTTTYGWEVDLHMKVAGFHLAAEYVQDHAAPAEDPTTPLTIPAEIGRSAMAAELGYMILPAQLGLAVRGELIDDNDADETNGDVLVIAGGIQYYWHGSNLRTGLDFVHREELKGQARDNDSLVLQLQLEL
jgi:hypothetical protein